MRSAMRVCPQNGQKLNGCVSTGLPAPEFVEDRDYLVVRFTRPVKTEGRLDDAELVLSMIRKDPEIRQIDIVEATGMSLSKVKRIIADLRDSGRMTRVGSIRNGRWVVKTDWCHRFGIGVNSDTDHDTDPEPRMPDPHSRLACQNGLFPLVGSWTAIIVCPQDGQKLNGCVSGISQWQKAQVMIGRTIRWIYPVPTNRKWLLVGTRPDHVLSTRPGTGRSSPTCRSP